MTALAYSPWGRVPLADNDNLPRVVAFTGVAGSGKTTASDYLVAKGYTRIKFAGPLKAMCRAIGLTDEHIEGKLKEQPCDLLQGKTPRHAMQTIGQQWGRDCIGEDFWTGLWLAAANDVLESGGRVVCDDCRYPNETALVRRLGGDIYRLVGRGGLSANTQAGGHGSEKMDFVPDVVIENTADRLALHNRIDREMQRYG